MGKLFPSGDFIVVYQYVSLAKYMFMTLKIIQKIWLFLLFRRTDERDEEREREEERKRDEGEEEKKLN